MRVAPVAVSVFVPILEAGLLLALGALPACAKTPPEAHSAPAASQEAAPAGGGAVGPDTQAPPGLDVTRLDEFQKKVFFRIVNTETSICGQAQSLLKLSTCRFWQPEEWCG